MLRTRAAATRLAAIALVGLSAVVATSCDPEVIGYRDTATQAKATPTATGRPTPRPLVTTDISGLSAAKIMTRTQTAAKAATSVRIKGTVSDGREHITMDLRLTKTSGLGSVSMNGASLTVLVIGRTAYLKPSDAFWRQVSKSKADANATIALIDGRWIKIPSTSKDYGGLTAFASKPKFFDPLFEPDGSVRKTAVRTVNGVRAIGLGDSEGRVWIDTATARPVRMEGHSKERTVALDLSEYNQVKMPKAPPADQVIDGKAFGK